MANFQKWIEKNLFLYFTEEIKTISEVWMNFNSFIFFYWYLLRRYYLLINHFDLMNCRMSNDRKILTHLGSFCFIMAIRIFIQPRKRILQKTSERTGRVFVFRYHARIIVYFARHSLKEHSWNIGTSFVVLCKTYWNLFVVSVF